MGEEGGGDHSFLRSFPLSLLSARYDKGLFIIGVTAVVVFPFFRLKA